MTQIKHSAVHQPGSSDLRDPERIARKGISKTNQRTAYLENH